MITIKELTDHALRIFIATSVFSFAIIVKSHPSEETTNPMIAGCELIVFGVYLILCAGEHIDKWWRLRNN